MSIKENIVKLVDQIAKQDPTAVHTFSQIMSNKVSSALENIKVDAAQDVFGFNKAQQTTNEEVELNQEKTED